MQKIYFVNSDYDPNTESRRFIFEFAGMSWVAITTKRTEAAVCILPSFHFHFSLSRFFIFSKFG